MEALTQAVEARLQWCYRRAEARLGRRFPYPQIGFTLRGMSAGAAHLADNRLRFNPVLLQENPQAFVDEVVPHEVAHLLVWQLHGRVRPHGREWQRMMAEVFDCPPRTRHSFDVSSVGPATFAYRCDCQTHPLTLRRHNKVQRGQANYQCRRCGQALIPA
ncbi:SprT protein [Ferrimonas sediminum]|uniref:Protein SprT n=1 Tax=Ferrimonas sediminum TaxID=718193 RepID=A0A1G8T685_9GAMM|nr:SprT family zinc-dependent metalloprotease [Ferrimonas sediminum]SDJ36927.1 SprT protein [Ferrimonas sediminum]